MAEKKYSIGNTSKFLISLVPTVGGGISGAFLAIAYFAKACNSPPIVAIVASGILFLVGIVLMLFWVKDD